MRYKRAKESGTFSMIVGLLLNLAAYIRQHYSKVEKNTSETVLGDDTCSELENCVQVEVENEQ